MDFPWQQFLMALGNGLSSGTPNNKFGGIAPAMQGLQQQMQYGSALDKMFPQAAGSPNPTPTQGAPLPGMQNFGDVLRALPPQMGMQMLPMLLETQMKRQDSQQTPLSAQEAAAMGLPDGTVATKDPFGNITIVSKPDYLSDKAFKQKMDETKAAQAPEWANVADAQARLAEQKREFQLTNPQLGGGPDQGPWSNPGGGGKRWKTPVLNTGPQPSPSSGVPFNWNQGNNWGPNGY